jgi:hypothetical protein
MTEISILFPDTAEVQQEVFYLQYNMHSPDSIKSSSHQKRGSVTVNNTAKAK